MYPPPLIAVPPQNLPEWARVAVAIAANSTTAMAVEKMSRLAI
jgi:hypothetical protein